MIPRLELDPSLKSMVPRDHPIVQTMDQVDEYFGGSAIIVLAVESDSLFSESTLEKFEMFQDSLEAIDLVDKVTSLYTASRILSTEDGFTVAPVLETYPNSAAGSDSLKQLLLDNAQVVGNLISSDGRMMAFICRPTASFDYDEHVLLRAIKRIVARFSGPEKIYYSGLPITRADVTDQMRHDMRMFLPYGFLLMILFLALSFRSWMGVFLPLFVVVISTVWTFGLMGALGMTLPFTGVLIPVMLIAIANDYGIHIIAHYYEFTTLNPGAPRTEIIKKTLRSLGVPILLAGLTTVVGFLGLLGHVLPRAREMGLLMSFGIFVAFIMSMVLIPAALSLLRRPLYLTEKSSLQGINRFLQSWGHFFIKYRKPFLTTVVIATALIGLGTWKVQVDANPDHYYKKNARIRVHNEAISKVFGGATQISILIEDDIKSPRVLRAIDQLSRHLEKNPLVTRTSSVVDIVKEINQAFHGGNPQYRTIPDSKELISQYLFLYGLTAGEDAFDIFLDDPDEPQHAQILIRLKKVQTLQIAELIKDTKDYIRANFYDMGSMKIAGPAALLGALSSLIVRGQILSLIISTGIIFLIMTVAFRSFTGGLLSILPLAAAIIIIFGFMGYAGIELNIATAMISSIMVGVGVDYTVHFLWHLREHIREGQDLETAIFTTLRISGKGIVFNALSVIIGFSVLLLSVFLPVNFFGVLIVLSISICLFGALAILPALISMMKPRFLYK